MATYVIKESDGTIINPSALGDLDFFKNIYPDKVIEKIEAPKKTSEEIAKEEELEERIWRDGELGRTDVLYLLDDYPDKDKLKTYRQALRDWPSTSNFPNTRPTL